MREIFVFGSNTQGRHGKGTALEARLKHGAIYGKARGFQGESYAIVTKSLTKNEFPIRLDDIKREVDEFIRIAKKDSDWVFNVTPIGCGLAGFTPEQIAPLFKDAPDNVKLPEVFLKILNS